MVHRQFDKIDWGIYIYKYADYIITALDTRSIER